MINTSIGYIICESEYEPMPIELKPKLFNGKVVGTGILQRANEKNRNGRFYAKEELFPQLTAPRTLELLNVGYLRAEKGHPLSKDLARQSTIDDTLTCARFLKLWTEDDFVKAEFVATNNQLGEFFNRDLLEGCLPAWSLRALGSVVQTARGAEVRNLRLITYDQVIYPSHPGAYTTGLVTESSKEIVTPTFRIEKPLQEASIIPIYDNSVFNYVQSESANLKFVKECFDFMYDQIVVNEAGTKVLLTTKDGESMCINLESYVHNDLMNYAKELQDLRDYYS